MNKFKEVIPYALILIAGLIFGSTDFNHIQSSALVAALITAIASFGAAWAGANRAFTLQEKVEKDKISEACIVAGNLAIFNLELMWLVLNDYKNTVITPAKKDESMGYIEMYPCISYGKDTKLDMNSLAFLIKDHVELLNQLRRMYLIYQYDVNSINEVSRVYREELRPILIADAQERGDPSIGTIMKDDILINKIGIILHSKMLVKSRKVIKAVEKDLPKMQECILQLVNVINELYPGQARQSVNFSYYE